MPRARRRLVKLVRDRIGQFVSDDVTVSYDPVGRNTHMKLLRRKLVEEAIEYSEEPSVGELADVLEVIKCLAKLDLGVTLGAVQKEMRLKRCERGGFEGGTAMFVQTTASARHEGEHG